MKKGIKCGPSVPVSHCASPPLADPELGGEEQIMLYQAKFKFDNQEILVACQ